MYDDNILEEALEYANEEFKLLKGIKINLDDLVFEERCALNCFYCGRYGKNWRCPPKIPKIDHKKLFSEFDNGALVYVEIPFNESTYDTVRNDSSNILHRGMLRMEKYMWNHNNSTYLSFIAGACKLCKNGCGEHECNNPYLSRSPVEALGINIIKTAAKYNFDISFPPKTHLIRCGLLVW